MKELLHEGLQDIASANDLTFGEQTRAPQTAPFCFKKVFQSLFHMPVYDGDLKVIMQDFKPNLVSEAESTLDRLTELSQNRSHSTKIIMSHHVQGLHDLLLNQPLKALDSFQKAVEAAINANNQIAQALVQFHIYEVNRTLGRYGEALNSLKRLNRIYQELDLVDEKIITLIDMADVHRSIGDLKGSTKLIHLARNLHTAFCEWGSYNNRHLHFVIIKLSQAKLESKSGHFPLAIELVHQCQDRLNDGSLLQIGEENKADLQIECLLLLQNLFLASSQRERSMANLNHLKKEKTKESSPVLELKYSLFKTEHEILFEGKELNDDCWSDEIIALSKLGEGDFILEQTNRLMVHFAKHENGEHLSSLQALYQTHLNRMIESISDAELSLITQQHYQNHIVRKFSQNRTRDLKQFIDYCRDLFGETNINSLSEKALKIMMSFTSMDRGFLVLFDSGDSKISASSSIDVGDLKNPNSPLHGLLSATKQVLVSHRSFAKDSQQLLDLSHIDEKLSQDLKIVSERALLVLPLIINGDGIGCFYLDRSLDFEGPISEQCEIYESLVSLISFAINNSYHLNVKQKDLKSIQKMIAKHKSELEGQKHSLENIIGISAKKRELIDDIQKTLQSSATITMIGESGTGKEMLARTIHYNSNRRHNRFVAINCAAVPESLLESELFGYVKGAFTGAHEDKKGLIAVADGGTLFLDEIGEMPLSMQVKLLRVLQEREVLPLGATTPVKINIRLVCATNRNLSEMVAEELFREDLYYRINVVQINVPSLRERQDDIPLLADHALQMYAIENQVPQKSLSSQALQFLCQYSWPGNIRELINIMYNLSIFVDKPVIELADLMERKELFRADLNQISVNNDDEDLNEITDMIDEQEVSLSEAKNLFERLQIKRALKIYNGQITSASYHLQMPRPQVSRLVKKYGLKEDKDAK